MILSWEDMQVKRKYRPPEWMWHLDEELVDWFKWVRSELRSPDDDDDDEEEDFSQYAPSLEGLPGASQWVKNDLV